MIIAVALVALILILDQWSKATMLALFATKGTSVISVTPFLQWSKVWNKGMSFGMLQGLPGGNAILLAIAAIIVVGLSVWMSQQRTRLGQISLALVIGGAIGNMIDRFRHGAVADFIDLYYGAYHWPTFNIADAAICIGVAGLLLSTSTGTKKRS
jgi:signal peptidase II